MGDCRRRVAGGSVDQAGSPQGERLLVGDAGHRGQGPGGVSSAPGRIQVSFGQLDLGQHGHEPWPEGVHDVVAGRQCLRDLRAGRADVAAHEVHPPSMCRSVENPDSVPRRPRRAHGRQRVTGSAVEVAEVGIDGGEEHEVHRRRR